MSVDPYLTKFQFLSNPLEHNTRYRGSSYRGRGYRVGRPPTVHRHRTLNLNPQPSSSESSPSTPTNSTDNSQWVSRTDRHKQLINANIYQQQAESRAQAIEQTRQRKLTQQYSSEKTRFNTFVQQNSGNTTPNHGPAEITIAEARFLVRDGGKKLVRSAGRSMLQSCSYQTILIFRQITLVMPLRHPKAQSLLVYDFTAPRQATSLPTELSRITGTWTLCGLTSI